MKSSRPAHKSFLCKLHPDFHMPSDVDIGEGFDGESYAKKLKENHVDAIAMYGKCHYGHAYYYTEVGTRHPRLKTDMMAEVVRGAKKYDIGVVMDYSVFLDNAEMI